MPSRRILRKILSAGVSVFSLSLATPAAGGTADLGVTLSPDPTGSTVTSVVGYGQTRAFTATVTSAGPSRVDGVTLDVAVPADWEIADLDASCTSNPAGTAFSCDLGTILDPPNSPVEVGFALAVAVPATLPATCTAGAALSNITATVSGGTTANPNTDPNGGNDSATSAGFTLRPFADLAADFTGPAAASAGATVTFSGSVTNNGPCDAGSVRITNSGALPLVSNTGPCTFDSNLRCAVGPLAASATANFTADFAIPRLASDIISSNFPNSIAVSDVATDSSPTVFRSVDLKSSNNSADTLTLVGGPASSGGCSTGGAAAPLVLLGLLALPVLRRRRS